MRPVLWAIVLRIVGRRVPPANVPPVLGDLLEDYEHIAAVRGRVSAEWWLMREVLSLAAAYRRRTSGSGTRGILDVLRSDTRQGWRSVRARPATTLATIAVLTLGIGLGSAMFALADPYTLRPLPYGRPHELHVLSLSARLPKKIPRLSDWQARSDLFTGLSTSRGAGTATVRGNRGDVTLRLTAVSRTYFDVLGVPIALPADWRATGSAEETPLVITAGTHFRLFGSADGQHRLLTSADREGLRFRVVGVLPSSFLDPFVGASGTAPEGFVPLGDEPLVTIEATPTVTRTTALAVVARVRPGVAPETVEAALSTASRNARAFSTNGGIVVTARSLTSRLIARVRPLASGALIAGLLILVTCAANVANLLLARGASRTREFAAREALGASRGAIARLVLVELGMVTIAGVAAGLACATFALDAVAMVVPDEYVSLGAPAISNRVLLFACAAGVVVIVAGLVPAWAAWRVTPLALFAQTSPLERRIVRVLRFTMTAAQTAIAVVLLVGATLLGRSFVNLVTQDPGYEGSTLAVRVSYPSASPGTQLRPTVDATLDRLRRLPGATDAAVMLGVLVDGWSMAGVGPRLTINGRGVSGGLRQVSAGFFETAGARLVAGRLPHPGDHERSMVVSESFAHRCCDGRTPIGLTATVADRSYEIVGVVKDVYTSALDQVPGPVAFLPLADQVLPIMNYLVRVDRPDPALALAVEREVRAASPDATVSDGATMRERLMRSVNDRSFATLLVVFFAVAAMGVTAAGLAGVVGFLVARRTREIAIRMAIGANAAQVRRLVTREATLAAAMGSGVGFAAGAWLSRLLEALLYGMKPADPSSLVMAAGIALGVVVLAAWLPASRAVRLSPTVALRVE